MRSILYCLMLLALACPARAGDFTLTSPAVSEGGALAADQILNGFGCTGANLSPELHWQGAPEGVRSYALTMYDPDAPTGSGWWHWVVFDIPAGTEGLPEGAGNGNGLPTGAVQSRTDFGAPGYGGACPPEGSGPHHYVITLYALDLDALGADPDNSAAMIGFFLSQHTLATATLTATFER